MCRLRFKCGVCFQFGRTRVVAPGCEALCECALHIACSSAFVSLMGWNSGSGRLIPAYAVLVRGSDENNLLSGSSEW